MQIEQNEQETDEDAIERKKVTFYSHFPDFKFDLRERLQILERPEDLEWAAGLELAGKALQV